MMEYENTKHNVEKKLATQCTVDYHSSALVITLLTGSCSLRLQLSITTEDCTAFHWPGKRSKFEVEFLLNVYCFPTIVKLENNKLNHHKSRTVCIAKMWRIWKPHILLMGT